MPPVAALDLTVVITTHAEGRLLRPTLRSVSAALARVVELGWSCELLIVCDNADEATSAEARRWQVHADGSFAIRLLEVALGESGAARNAGAEDARGEFVGFVDGDDLVSENYFATAVEVLTSTELPAIVHPEYVISFGARSVVWRTDPTDHHDVSYRDLIRHNLWPSSATARRDVYLAHPYRSLHPGSGYGPEDWVWNIDTSAAGIVHLVGPGTVFFYRVRERGGVNNRHALSILPPFDLSGLREHLSDEVLPELPAPTETTREKQTLTHSLYAALLPAARWSTSRLSFDARHRIYRRVRKTLGLPVSNVRVEPAPTVSPAVSAALSHITEIEPAISWTALRVLSLPVWHAHDDGFGEYLETALADIGDRGDAIVFVPWLGVGGADLVALNYAKALNASGPHAGRVTILATSLAERTRRDLIPESLNVVQLDERWLQLDRGDRNRLLAQLIVLARPKLIVSVNCHHLTEALPSYTAQILDGTRLFLTLFAFDRLEPGYPTNPITDDSHREYLDNIAGIITDNTTTARLVEDILALPPERILVHRQPALDSVPPLDPSTAAYRDEVFSADHPFRMVWPHRLDGEKRPDVLVRLSAELRRRGIHAVIDVWGQRVLTSDGDSLMQDLEEAGIVYRGPYSGGLAALPTHEYHALLLTSQSEGLPLVLVQSLLLGLPVIASKVGGVPDIILDGRTGLLSHGPDDIDGFVNAVELLMTDVTQRREIIHDGHTFAGEKHSWQTFTATVDDALTRSGQHTSVDS